MDVLDGLFRSEAVSPLPPPAVRASVFRASAWLESRDDVVAAAARELGTSPGIVEQSLFADLPSERVVRPPVERVEAPSLALRCNLAIAQAALKRSSSVTIAIESGARAVVRHAKLRGLICTVACAGEPAVRLEVSGPLALFRKTVLYGRYLAELIPLLPWAGRFELHADCQIRDLTGELTLTPSDPLLPAKAPRRYDSALEKRFARDFKRATSDWEIAREPEPVAVDGTLIFPDFSVVHVRDPGRRWLLEIVGFWTSTYLENKLGRLRRARIPNLVLCVDETLDCGQGRLPEGCPVLRFRRKIDPRDLLGLIEGGHAH